jgi:hypothetical protein
VPVSKFLTFFAQAFEIYILMPCALALAGIYWRDVCPQFVQCSIQKFINRQEFGLVYEVSKSKARMRESGLQECIY